MTSNIAANVLIIVPASGEEARRHFNKTIRKRWSLDEIIKLGIELEKDVTERLRRVQYFAIWGSTPRVKGIKKLFKRLEEAGGGVVAFYQNGKIVCWGRIFAWARNKSLAEKLWGRDSRGDTWEYVYFIRDMDCVEPGIDWNVVREKLGYNEGFFPRGHIVVKPDKVKIILEKYGDIISFLNKLAGKNVIERDGAFMPRSRYNPYLIQALKHLKSEELLEVIGEAALRLANKYRKEVSKDDVAEVLGEILRSMDMHDRVQYLASRNYPLLINDLRRLGVIEAGDPDKEWRSEVKATVTILAERARHIINYCIINNCAEKNIVEWNGIKENNEIKNVCKIIGGAYIVIANVLPGIVPAGSRGLRYVFESIRNGRSLEELAKDIASKINASESEIITILRDLKTLITIATRTLINYRQCIPLIYTPLDLYKLLEALVEEPRGT